jgi:DUF177 domain-containing protein
VSDTTNPFILNVGFIVHQTVGYSREFPFDFPSVFLSPDIRLENLTGYTRVTRTAQGLLIQLKLTANTLVECARCLVEFPQLLETSITDLYAFTTNSVTDSGLILPENGKINLAPIVRDEMLLSIPINPICQPDCKGLCPICGENLNEMTCNHTEVESDPRLEKLRSLLE